jgi:hypothetical protein
LTHVVVRTVSPGHAHLVSNFKDFIQIKMFPSHHRGLHILIVCVWVIVLAGLFYIVAKPVRDASRDYLSYYIGAAALQYEDPYALETYERVAAAAGIEIAGLYLYPPTFAVMLQPALLVSPYAGSLLWFGVNLGFLLIGIGILLKQSTLSDHRMRAALLLLPMFFTPVLMTFYLGQVNLLIFLLIVLVWLTFVQNRPYASGALLALSVWIKIWPIILIGYFAWKREWKVLLGAVIGLLLIGLLTLALAGVGPTLSFFTDRLPEISSGTEQGRDHLNQSIPGFFAKLFAPSSEYVRPLAESRILAQQGSRIVSALLVLMTVLLSSWPITVKDRAQFSSEFMLVVIASMLITGRLFESNLVVLLPAYFFIAEELQRKNLLTWRAVALPIVSVVLIDLHRVIWTFANPDRQALPWFLLSFPFLGLMLVWVIFAMKRLREINTRKAGFISEPLEPA